jgi:hypothetical protein
MPMAMAKYWSFEALDAVAEVDVIEGKLIAGLRIEANAAAEQGSNTARELQPRCLFDQRHLIDPKRCRCLGTPVAPDVSADIRLPHLTSIVHIPRKPSRPVSPEVVPSPTGPEPSFAWLKATC